MLNSTHAHALDIQNTRAHIGLFADSPPPYLLAFSADEHILADASRTLVRAENLPDIRLLNAILGESCEIAVSETFRKRHPTMAARCRSLPVDSEARFEGADSRTLSEHVKGIPLALNALVRTPLALRDDDALPEPIDQRLVHKKKSPIF
ncbi:MAG: hypothetical protein H6926_02465 [Chromatiales bacterium]|nr:hypothetical protein [Chromatiales bacterium]